MDEFVQTRASQAKADAEKLLEVTAFEKRKKSTNPAKKFVKKEKKIQHDSEEDFDDEDGMDDGPPMDDRRKQELEMKRYRYEVIKLGISALNKKEARAAKVELAIGLGAKPPKNRRRNYKKILAERKEEKLKTAREQKFASGFDSSKLLLNKLKKEKAKKHLIKKKKIVVEDKKAKVGNKRGKGPSRGKKPGGILGEYGRVTKANREKNSGKKQKRRN